MSLISIQARPERLTLSVVMRRTGIRFHRARTIFKHQGIRAGAALALLAAFALVLFAGVPAPSANNNALTVPDAWRGTWEVTVSCRDHATGMLVATDVTTDEICPGEPIVPRLLNTITNLSGTANESELKLTGHAKYSPQSGCNVHIEVTLDSQRDGDTWSGTGSWSAREVGNCEHSDFGEDFVVSGRRINTEAACDTPSSSLLQRFFTNGLLSPVLAGRE